MLPARPSNTAQYWLRVRSFQTHPVRTNTCKDAECKRIAIAEAVKRKSNPAARKSEYLISCGKVFDYGQDLYGDGDGQPEASMCSLFPQSGGYDINNLPPTTIDGITKDDDQSERLAHYAQWFKTIEPAPKPP